MLLYVDNASKSVRYSLLAVVIFFDGGMFYGVMMQQHGEHGVWKCNCLRMYV